MNQRRILLTLSAFFALAILLTFACSQPTPKSLEDGAIEVKTQSIINGNKDNRYPAAGAIIGDKKASFCTGTLIAPRLVLTAAHCIDAFSRVQGTISFRIDVPIDQFRFKPSWIEVDRQKTKRHPQYTGTQTQSINHDIAMIVLKRPVFEIQPMPFNATKMDSSFVGKALFFMGYGRITTANNIPAKRKWSTTLTINGIDGVNKPNTVAYAGNNTSVCQGDSGGPAMLMFNGLMHVVGVTSHGTNANCTGTSYSYRTDAYVNWIQGFIDQYSTCEGQNPTCGACGTCDQKACKPKAVASDPGACKVCKTDQDCGQGVCVRIGSGLRCAQACDGTQCCPSGSVCTQDGKGKHYCLPHSMQCPDVACTTAAQCSSTEECKAGKCVLRLPKIAPTTCQPCKQHSDCGQGGYCESSDGRGGRCLQACEANSELCPKSFICKQLAPGIQQCVSRDGVCWANCQSNADCKGGLVCTSGICQRSTGGTEGEPCDSQIKCKTGLKCINNRCFQACGVPNGTAGAPCRPGNQCDPGLRCFPNPLGGSSVCVEPCQGGTPCKNGGSCFPGINICSCQNDSQCSNGAKCNPVIQGLAGACSNAKSTPCPSGQTCVSSPGSTSFCALKDSGTRQAGQSCNANNRCKAGLTCIPGVNTCVEDCTQSNVCKSGGACRALFDPKAKYCVCTSDKDCKASDQCQLLGQGTGLCKPKDEEACRAGDCPSGFVCKNKKCVQGSKPDPEPTNEKPSTPEKVDEPAVQTDAGNTQEKPPTERTQHTEKGSQNDKSTVQPDSTKPPTKSCGCSLQTREDSPSVPFSWMLLVLLFPWIRRKK